MKTKNDIFYYLSLLIILSLGGIAIYIASPNRYLQFLLIVITSFFYILWGILHHFLNHDLDERVMLEYFLIAALGVVVGLFILKGGLGF